MSEQFYSSIATYYRYIFPFNPDQINFLRGVLPFNGARILDVGCATGELAFALTRFGFPVWAIDSDAEMIELAIHSKPEDTLFPVFEQLDMRKMAEHFPESYFDTAICFGNTLVHLLTEDDLRAFFQETYKILAPEGKLGIQILNYEHIVDQHIDSLPIIENEQVRFVRNYRFHPGSNLIDFNTKLTDKQSGKEINNSVSLFALRKSRLQEMLADAGFENPDFYGNFNGSPLTETSMPLIVTCQKHK